MNELIETLKQSLLDRKMKVELKPEEIESLRQVMAEQSEVASFSVEAHKLVTRAMLQIDGCTESFTRQGALVIERFQELGIDTQNLAENFAPTLISLISIKEKVQLTKDESINYLIIKDLENFKIDPSLADFVTTAGQRRRVAALVEALAQFVMLARKPQGSAKLVAKLRDTDERIVQAEKKLNSYKEKTKSKDAAAQRLAQERADKAEQKERLKREAEEKRKKEALEKEEKRKRELVEKEEKKREELRKKEEKEEEKRKKEEERKKKEEEKRLLDEQKRFEEEAQKEKNKVNITKFFNLVPKLEEAQKMGTENGIIEERKSIWKKGLGSYNRMDWSDDRKYEFEDLLVKLNVDTQKNLESASSSAARLDFEYPLALLQRSLKTHLENFKEDNPVKQTTMSSEIVNELEDKKKTAPRKVFIKYEDYLFDCYEYRGLFKRRSDLVTARNPFSKDEDLIDYELSSDEEFQLEEADSIHSKAGDDEEEESGNEFEEDNFVVPDGYLSEEEFGSLDEDDKRRRL